MEEQVPFKVFTYWTEGDKPEVRRFGVDKGVVANFTYLNSKLLEFFPNLRNRSYSIGWKDEDDDIVSISTNDELLTALGVMCGGLIKLYVHCKDSNDHPNVVFATVTGNVCGAPNPAGPSKTLHVGVMCDSCENPVVGFRYKCTVCEDFDLCATCEAASCHPEHCMVRVPTPVMPRALIRAAIKRSRHFLKTVAGSMGEDCPYKKNRRDRSGERKRGDHHHGDHHHGDRHHGDRGDHHHRRQRPSWLETFTTYMNEYANLAGDILADNASENAPENKTKEPAGSQATGEQQPSQNASQAKTGETTSAPKEPEPTTSTQNNAEQNEFPFFPLNLNQDHVTKLLEMYRQFCAHSQPSTPFENNQDVQMEQEDKSEDADNSEASSVSAKGDRDGSIDKAEGWTVINNDKDLMGNASAPDEPAAPIGFNLPEEFQECVRISQGQSIYPPLNTATAVLNPKEAVPNVPTESAAEPMPVQPEVPAQPAQPKMPSQPAQPKMPSQPAQPNMQTQPAQPKMPTQPAQPKMPTQGYPHPTMQQGYPHPAQPQPQQFQQQFYTPLRPSRPHIEAAIKQMLAMGFTNEGGWLTQLLESKDGNIAAVLDLLTPVNPKV